MAATTFTTPSYNLLIADDDTSARETLREVFEPVGFRTYLASNGEEAVDIVRAHQDIHLALFDMHMPRLTGLEAVALVRQFKHTLPTILISADHDEQLMRRALSAQIYTVVAKPINARVLMYVVSRALTKFYTDLEPHES